VSQLLRATIYHTPRNAFTESNALECFEDGGLAIRDGRIAAAGDYAQIRKAHSDLPERDLRGGFLLPGFIDTHIHFPQVRIIGGLGYTLLDWLEKLTLPEEAKLADEAYAVRIAEEFVAQLAAHGTTTALVFGSHFEAATAALFDQADRTGLRVFSGLVLADRMLRPELHQTPQQAWDASKRLAARFKDRYVVTPRFALSASEPMLEVCQALLKEDTSLRFTTHVNENPREIEEVRRMFPSACDYVGVYENFGLLGRRSVLAHNVHARPEELRRLSQADASIAHCPSSNAALGSGIFPMRRHLEAHVRFALGTDVGGGTGFSLLKEALNSYLFQRVAQEPITLTAAQLLYLATRAGAEALAIEDETGDFTPGKSADLVYLLPRTDSTLANALKTERDPLSALITTAEPETIRLVLVNGQAVFSAPMR
jgi:guanine deaminase